MNEYFFSQSLNFIGAQQTGIDPRTGVFTLCLPLANINANYGMGPEVSLSLTSNSFSRENVGFGVSFGLPFTTYDKPNRLLRLSTGEQYIVEDDSDYYQGEISIKQKKLNNFIFERVNASETEKGYYKVTYKSGLVEILDDPDSSYPIKNTVSIQNYEGNAVYLKWKGNTARLESIVDDYHTLVSISYKDMNAPVVSVYPEGEEAYTIQLTLGNGYLEEVRQVEENYNWFFYYTAEGFIKEINHPTGLIEMIDYQEDVFQFPDNVYRGLPAAIRHTRYPESKGPKIVSSFTYTSNNYLGYQSGLVFEADRDNLYTVLNHYVYGSTEKQIHGNLIIEIERRYNSFHLNTSELTTILSPSGVKSTQVELEYYAIPGIPFERQPNQFQLVKKKTTTWRDLDGMRQEVHRTEFNADGNPILEIQPDGNQIQMVWYAAEGETGCPAEVNGFARFLKESVVIPNQEDYSTPIQKESYTYTNLGSSDLVVAKQQMKYSDGELLQSRLFDYVIDPNQMDYGRLNAIHDILYANGDHAVAYDSYQSFGFTVCGNEIIEDTHFMGHDGCEATTQTVYSAFAKHVLRETNRQGEVSSYVYDSMGRILRSTQAVGTKYESSRYWEYSLTNEGPVTHITDALGNQAKSYFDGLGRELRKYGFDHKGTGKWVELLNQEYDSMGQIKQKTVRDLQTSDNQFVNYSVRTDIDYDGWGQMGMLQFTDGIKVYQESDIVGLTSMRWQLWGNVCSGQWKKTMHSKSQRLEKEERINLQGQVVGSKLYYWDGLGRLREEVDELGRRVKCTYDAYGQILTKTMSDGTRLKYSYVPYLKGGEIARIEVSNAEGTQWVMGEQEFDSLGRLRKIQTGGRVTQYQYEGASPVPTKVIQPDGTVIDYTYIVELGNAIAQVKANDLIQTFDYDSATGEVIKSTEGLVSNTHCWNDYGLLEAETTTINNNIYDTDYQWTLRGKPVSHRDITGAQTRYERDQFGRVIRLVDQDVKADLVYDNLGRLHKKKVESTGSSTKIETEFEYNEFNQAVAEIIKDSNETQLRIERSWLKNGLLHQQTTKLNANSIKKEEYTYDVRNRLVEYTISGSTFPTDGYGQSFRKQVYEYDALNNIKRVETTLENAQVDIAVYDYANSADPTQLTSVTHSHKAYPAYVELAYDACGRMIVDQGGVKLRYDALGRLTQLEGQQHSSYQYNANNQLVNQTVKGGKNCQLHYRAGALVNQVLVEEEKKIRWIKGGAGYLAVNDSQDISLTASGQNEGLFWSLKNSDTQGKLHQYGAYGQGREEEFLPAFTGERQDPISGNYHLGNGYRSYNPVLMRFNCPDSLSPFGAGGINAYAYCAGDPINMIDPSGHSAMGIAGLFSGGLITQGLGHLGAGGGIALGVIGIIGAVSTFGASIAAMGTVMATTSLLINLAAEATGIASIAVGDKNPELSANLGWASLGLGIAGTATGFYSKSYKVSNKKMGSNQLNKMATFADVERVVRPQPDIRCNRIYALENERNNPYALISGHGREATGTTFISRSTVSFPVANGENLSYDHFFDTISRTEVPFSFHSYAPGTPIPDYMVHPPTLKFDGVQWSDENSITHIRNRINRNFNADVYAMTSGSLPLSVIVAHLEQHHSSVFPYTCRPAQPVPPLI